MDLVLTLQPEATGLRLLETIVSHACLQPETDSHIIDPKAVPGEVYEVQQSTIWIEKVWLCSVPQILT